ncbi:hypothetical protein MIDIC_390001 [Alphaproteobacteria bacterium]
MSGDSSLSRIALFGLGRTMTYILKAPLIAGLLCHIGSQFPSSQVSVDKG